MNLERINGSQNLTYEYQVNNTSKKDLDEVTCDSYKDFCNLYLVVAFDVTEENDENLFSKTKSSELKVN